MSEPGRPLSNRICLVAGASRGLGRGIARALGEAGATVIVTGRSSEAGPRTDQRSETFEDTAREVEAAGGKGHPYRCDHTSEREVDGGPLRRGFRTPIRIVLTFGAAGVVWRLWRR